MLTRLPGLLLAACALAHAADGLAQSVYPSKPIRLIVPLAPGGGNDLLSRYMSQKLSEGLGQQVIIDNRPGGSGMIGSEFVARSAPDGYTILMAGSGQMSINPSLYAKMPYDPAKDFQPISIVGSFSSMLTAHPSLPVRTVHDVIRLAREKPGQLNYASSGNGSGSHLSMELFKTMAKVNLVHIPYKGAGPALTDLLSGQVSLLFNNPLSSMPFVRSGRTRAIAVTGTKRLAAMPEVPTVAESGLPGFDSTIWLGFFAPAATPREVVMRLNREIVSIVQRPAVQEWLAQQGMDAVGNSPEDFAARIRADTVKWSAVIKASGARVD